MSAELMKSKFVLLSVRLSSVHIIDYLENCYANFFQILGVDCTGAYARFFPVFPIYQAFFRFSLTWDYRNENSKALLVLNSENFYEFKFQLGVWEVLLFNFSRVSSDHFSCQGVQNTPCFIAALCLHLIAIFIYASPV